MADDPLVTDEQAQQMTDLVWTGLTYYQKHSGLPIDDFADTFAEAAGVDGQKVKDFLARKPIDSTQEERRRVGDYLGGMIAEEQKETGKWWLQSAHDFLVPILSQEQQDKREREEYNNFVVSRGLK